jgi:uncharacterized protein
MRSLNSCLYSVRIWHRRLFPAIHEFAYNLFLFCVDLDELDSLQSPLIGVNKCGLYSFHNSDHLEKDNRPVKEKVVEFLKKQGFTDPVERILLVTNLRMLGYVFNPVSFYFCLNKNGNASCAVAEVHNTFGERKLFFLPDHVESSDTLTGAYHTKYFYVSPFSNLNNKFEFKLAVPSDTLNLKVNTLTVDGETELMSTMTGRKIDLTAAALLKATVLFPLVPLQVIALIHWNAFLLWLKKVPHHAKERNPHLQLNMLQPHKSIRQSGREQPESQQGERREVNRSS